MEGGRGRRVRERDSPSISSGAGAVFIRSTIGKKETLTGLNFSLIVKPPVPSLPSPFPPSIHLLLLWSLHHHAQPHQQPPPSRLPPLHPPPPNSIHLFLLSSIFFVVSLFLLLRPVCHWGYVWSSG